MGSRQFPLGILVAALFITVVANAAYATHTPTQPAGGHIVSGLTHSGTGHDARAHGGVDLRRNAMASG
jgi:hypothetical protein